MGKYCTVVGAKDCAIQTTVSHWETEGEEGCNAAMVASVHVCDNTIMCPVRLSAARAFRFSSSYRMIVILDTKQTNQAC